MNMDTVSHNMTTRIHTCLRKAALIESFLMSLTPIAIGIVAYIFGYS